MNELGSARFAAETGQTLTDFHSIDRFNQRGEMEMGGWVALF